MKKLYEIYLIKHQAEPFVMLDEMNLSYEQFIEKLKTSYSFNQMWGNGKETSKQTKAST
jgi:hypothetical protein